MHDGDGSMGVVVTVQTDTALPPIIVQIPTLLRNAMRTGPPVCSNAAHIRTLAFELRMNHQERFVPRQK